MPPDNAGRKQADTRFQPGHSGNPAGKPRGVRHKATQLAEKLMAADVEDVVRSVIIAAKAGDMTAARIVVDRLVPVRKGAPVRFPLGPIKTADDVDAALGAVAEAMAQGDLSPDEASTVAGVIDLRRKAIETTELERRLAEIEARLKDGGRS